MEAMSGVSYHKSWGRQYYETIIIPIVPIVNVEQFARLKQRDVNRFLDKARTLGQPDEVTRERIIDALTDYFSGEIEQVFSKKFQKGLINAIKVEPEFHRSILMLVNYFEKNLSESQKAEFIKNSIVLARSNVRVLYDSITDDLMRARKKDMEDVMLAKQVVYEIAKLLDQCHTQVSKKRRMKQLPKEAMRNLNLSLYLLIRLEAARRGKIDEYALHDDLTIASQYTENILGDDRIGSVYDILGLIEA
jgi:hypothetical protein